MAWDSIQTKIDRIRNTDWNAMVAFIKALPTSGTDIVACVYAGQGSLTESAIVVEVESGYPVIQFPDAAAGGWSGVVKVPSGTTSISSIKIYHNNRSTGDVYIRFRTVHLDVSVDQSAKQSDTSDVYTAYTGGASDLSISSITLPSGAYDELTGIEEHDYIGVYIQRNGASGSDTYNTVFQVTHVEIMFA